MVKTINASSNIIPTTCARSNTLSLTGFPLKISRSKKTTCPPSRAGIGSKFIKANVNNYNEIAPIMTSYSFDFVYHYAAIA